MMLTPPTTDCSAGMSKDLYDLLRSNAWFPDSAAGKAFAYAIAQWIYVQLTTNAVATVAAGIPVTTSTGAGATTAPGTGGIT